MILGNDQPFLKGHGEVQTKRRAGKTENAEHDGYSSAKRADQDLEKEKKQLIDASLPHGCQQSSMKKQASWRHLISAFPSLPCFFSAHGLPIAFVHPRLPNSYGPAGEGQETKGCAPLPTAPRSPKRSLGTPSPDHPARDPLSTSCAKSSRFEAAT